VSKQSKQSQPQPLAPPQRFQYTPQAIGGNLSAIAEEEKHERHGSFGFNPPKDPF
jgi:hypothetical protein